MTIRELINRLEGYAADYDPHSVEAHLQEEIDAINKKLEVAPQPVPADTGNPFAGVTLYVNPNSTAAVAAKTNPVFSRISDQPTAIWLTGGTEAEVYNQVKTVLADAGSKLVTFVVYNIPNRDAGGQSSGGAADDKAYYAWCGSIDAAIKDAGNPKVVFILEPDAMGFALKEDTTGKYKRFEYLKIANDILTKNPNRYVYLDIAMWNPDTQPMADAIKASLIQNIRGVALNTSGYTDTAACMKFGEALGLPYVIDTSRNGKGPAPAGQWENVPGMALGANPLTLTGPHLDANLWIKIPGESDGADNGHPAAGQWDEKYAEELITNAK
jgi:endoglucanase